MHDFEYTVIPAPARGDKAKGAKTPGDRYAATVTETLNRMARDGWEYVRCDTLPTEERSGLTGRMTVFHNLLIFRRPAATGAARPAPAARPEPAPVADLAPAEPVAPPVFAQRPEPQPAAPEPAKPTSIFSEKMRLNDGIPSSDNK